MTAIFLSSLQPVSAATTIKSYNFSGTAGTFGGKFTQLDYLEGREAGYVKVSINTSGGDTFNLQLVYTYNWVSELKVLKEIKSIKAKGNSYTFYFISENGKCPTTDTSKCVRVPVIDKISESNNAISYYDVMYGIQVYNGSWLGGTLSVNGTYSFVNY